MLELFTKYSMLEIVSFLVILAGATKGFFSFMDWAIDRLRKIFKKENRQQEESLRVNKLEENVNTLITDMSEMKTAINLLMQSDKDDIKAWITERHHYFCYEKHYIDDYSLDCIEKRYRHYTDEGGNSFIGDLMKDLRQLPKVSGLINYNDEREGGKKK